jgi:hypothetical protein
LEVNMSTRGSFFLRLLGVFILVGIMLAGGALLFRAGQMQGYQMGAAGAAANAAAGETLGTAPVVPYGPGYWPGYGPGYYPGPHFGFFPFGWLCGSIFLVFLALFAFRLIFRPWGWRHHGMGPGGWGQHPHGPYGWGPYGYGPPPPGKDQPQAETGAGGAGPGQTPGASAA